MTDTREGTPETPTVTAIVIPVEGTVREFELPVINNLVILQQLVGGYIELIPLTSFIDPSGRAAAIVINEDGKMLRDCKPNPRATAFLTPSSILLAGDYIRGDMVLVGFDVAAEEFIELPQSVLDRVQVIENIDLPGWPSGQ
jgi:hypothetical protein